MRYQIPQYLETDVKLVGPFTIYQFIWVVFSVGILFILYKTLEFSLFVVLGLPVAVIGGAFGFVKIEGISLLSYAGYTLSFFTKPKKFVFKKKKGDIVNL